MYAELNLSTKPESRFKTFRKNILKRLEHKKWYFFPKPNKAMPYLLLYLSHSLQAFFLARTIQYSMIDNKCKISGAQWLSSNPSSATFLAVLP